MYWLLADLASAATLMVCPDCPYAFLDDAIVDASNGDTIVLREPGTYPVINAISASVRIEGVGPDTHVTSQTQIVATADVTFAHLTLDPGTIRVFYSFSGDLVLVDVHSGFGSIGFQVFNGSIEARAARLVHDGSDEALLAGVRADIAHSVVLSDGQAVVGGDVSVLDSVFLPRTGVPSHVPLITGAILTLDRTVVCGDARIADATEYTLSHNGVYLGTSGPPLSNAAFTGSVLFDHDLHVGGVRPLAEVVEGNVFVRDSIITHQQTLQPLLPDSSPTLALQLGPLLHFANAGALTAASEPVEGELTADPLYAGGHVPGACDPALYTLGVGSPAIDQADDVDLDGSAGDLGPFGGPAPYGLDADLDGYPAEVDCDDTDPAVHPDAYDACGDGIDADCDGIGVDPADDEDGDGIPSVDEVASHPCFADTDGDGLDDATELALGLDAFRADTDGDTLLDAAEVDLGLDATDPDPDGDGVNDAEEVRAGTDAFAADTDGDGLDDLEELGQPTDPLDPDTDGDGLLDGDEALHGADPIVADTDGDGILDGGEVVMGTDPTRSDSDDDGLSDFLETTLGTDPTEADTDGDGIDDGTEYLSGSDPTEAPDPVDTAPTADTGTPTAPTTDPTVPDPITTTPTSGTSTTSAPDDAPSPEPSDDEGKGGGCQTAAGTPVGAWLALLLLGWRRR